MTNWKYCVSRNIEPNIAKKIIVMPELAAVNRGFLKNRTSSIGWSECASHHANVPSTTAASANAARIFGDVQPSCGASMMP